MQFSPMLGGLLCKQCGNSGMVLQKATLACMEHLQIGRAERIDVARFRGVNRTEVNGALRAFLTHHIESRRRVRSLDFLDKMIAAEGKPAYQAEPSGGA